MLKIFEVPLSMVSTLDGTVLLPIGFSLFLLTSSNGVIPTGGGDSTRRDRNVAFSPLAMPIMAGPGAKSSFLRAGFLTINTSYASL
jgi:small neutral amino acid transporter SnatA (MarC family)